MVVVALVAGWLALLSHGDRLRRMSSEHMRESARVVAETARLRSEPRLQPTRRSDLHLKMARKYSDEADLVESITLTMLLAAGLFVVLSLIYRWKRRRSAP
jgi:hypothetical protein